MNFLLKDTLQAETSDMRLDEVQVFVSVVVLLLQRADGVTLMSDKWGSDINVRKSFACKPKKNAIQLFIQNDDK